MAANKQETGNQEDADVDVSYFLFLLCEHCDPSLFLFSGLKNESCRCGESDLIHFFGANFDWPESQMLVVTFNVNTQYTAGPWCLAIEHWTAKQAPLWAKTPWSFVHRSVIYQYYSSSKSAKAHFWNPPRLTQNKGKQDRRRWRFVFWKKKKNRNGKNILFSNEIAKEINLANVQNSSKEDAAKRVPSYHAL